jgi:hypothetical protein
MFQKICRENKSETIFVFSNFLFKNCALYEIMWKYAAQSGRPQMTICSTVRQDTDDYAAQSGRPQVTICSTVRQATDDNMQHSLAGDR